MTASLNNLTCCRSESKCAALGKIDQMRLQLSKAPGTIPERLRTGMRLYTHHKITPELIKAFPQESAQLRGRAGFRLLPFKLHVPSPDFESCNDLHGCNAF